MAVKRKRKRKSSQSRGKPTAQAASRARAKEQGALADALHVVRARRPRDLPPGPDDQAAAVLETNAWYRGSKTVLGVGLGRKFTKGRKSKRLCVQVFVEKKPKLGRLRHEQIVQPFCLGGRKIATDVIWIKSARLELAVGSGIGAGTANVGSVAGFLIDAQRNLHVLSAAHVLGESFRKDADPRVQRNFVRRGSTIYDYGPQGTLAPPPVAIGTLLDRSVPDFPNLFPAQTLDAAVARVTAPLAVGIDPAQLPYGPPGWPAIDDEVRVLGVGTVGQGAPGEVVTLDFTHSKPFFRYADPKGRMLPTLITDLCLASYESAGGDSGGIVVRTSDDAAVGLHIGSVETADAGRLGVFLSLFRVLGRWPHLRLLHRPA